MSAICQLELARTQRPIRGVYNGHLLDCSSAAGLYELLGGNRAAGATEPTILRLHNREHRLQIDHYQYVDAAQAYRLVQSLVGRQAWAVYRVLYRPGEDPLLPVLIEVTYPPRVAQIDNRLRPSA